MQDKKLLDGIISDYYNSVEDSFFYRLRNLWKINASIVFLGLSSLYLFLNIIPILPGFKDDYLFWLFKLIKNIFTINIGEYSFWIKWALGSITSIVIFVIAFLFFKYWNVRENKKSINPIYLNFCFAFTIRKELKSFLINENVTHLDNISKYFEKVISSIVLTPFYTEKTDGSKPIPLPNLRDELLKKYNWIIFNDEANNLINAFNSIESKIKRRLEQRVELDKILPLVDFLTLYEFSLIKPNQVNENNEELKNQRYEYLKRFAQELNKLNELEKVQETDITKRTKIKSIFIFFINLFTNSNIIVMFLSWLILLTLIFVASSILILNKLNLTIDSTILIGLLSAPFLGAITFTATIYSKNKK